MKLGEFELDKIYCANSYEAIKKIPNKSVDCIYTDIPYFMPCILDGVAGGNMEERVCKNASSMKQIASGIDYSILNEFIRIMKKINCFIWCNKFQMLDLMNFFHKYNTKYEILVWCKDNPIPMTKNCWLSDVEYCLWFGEEGMTLNDGYYYKSKWYSSPINKKDKDKFEHPTIKPLELVKRHLLHTTQQNDIVADFFVGSGTTCVACKDLGRHYIGFDISQKWVDIANNRLNNIDANGQISLFLK